ncbi:MAG TPA: cupin domain-containing protein [Jiangellaceae bacterium]
MQDQGPEPYVVDIEDATLSNDTFRTALWTGTHLQMTVMNIPSGGEVGLEMHDDRDQFLRIESGTARVQMGPEKDDLRFDREVEDDWVILVPAGSWHNVTNVGDEPLKLYSLYAPPEHSKGTVHKTKAESDAEHH